MLEIRSKQLCHVIPKAMIVMRLKSYAYRCSFRRTSHHQQNGSHHLPYFSDRFAPHQGELHD